jgi:ribonuclease T1
MTSPRTLRARLGGLVALALVAGAAVLVQGLSGPDAARPGRPPAAATARPSVPAPRDGLATVTPADLPAQARRTLALIDAGGPFPYDRDGAVFADREGLLPAQRRGCYREYTVPTPGEGDRGARRIVTSCSGPRYWSPDHYESFARISPERPTTG